ncbi:MAG: hypothetical protein QOE60_2070 [Thermoleophilaceae bacterium]|jgi:hypothetical protein|nr:hypothetical protein [Thermoleophilaceae bacterium]
MNRFAAAPLTMLVLVVGLVACGGSDAPSKADFAKSADEICNNAEKALQNVGKDANTPAEIAAAVDRVIDQTQKSVDDLKGLDRPDGDAGKAADKFIGALSSDIEDKGLPALKELRDAIKKNDRQAAQKAAERLQAIQTTNSDQLARDIGAKGCAD